MCFIHFFGAIREQSNIGKPLSVQKTLTSSTTLPETNIEPENGSSQKESSIPTINFQVQAVSFREGMLTIFEHLNRMPPTFKTSTFLQRPVGDPQADLKQKSTRVLGFPPFFSSIFWHPSFTLYFRKGISLSSSKRFTTIFLNGGNDFQDIYI